MFVTRINKVLSVLLLSAFSFFAQEGDKKIYDAGKEQDILFGKIVESDFEDADFSYWFEPEYQEYTVDSTTVDNIKSELNELQIVAILGTWCHDSHREVPRFLKILKYAGFPAERLAIYAVNGDKEAGIADFEKYDINFVPTFIFYRDGDEIGRIIEAPQITLEEDIADIIFNPAK